jgi:hypothetical protein
MIRTTVRAALTDRDRRLAIDLLAGGEESEQARLEGRCGREGADTLWDDPRLVPALLAYRGLEAPSVALLVYAVLRQLMLGVGIADRDVTDYCAALVLVFGRRDRAYRVSDYDENRYEYLVDLVEEADRVGGERQFRVRAHLGNFTLWLSGLFPDYIVARRARKGGPDLEYYEAVGSSAFRQASDHVLAGRYGLETVLRSAGRNFGALRVALNRFSDRLIFPSFASPDRLMRQAADDFRFQA